MNKAEIIKKLSKKFELIQQFENSSPETNIELIKLIRELRLDLKQIIEIFKTNQIINNWKYCKKNSDPGCIEGQILKDGKTMLILDKVMHIDFEEKIVTTENNRFFLGKELHEDKKNR